MNVAMPCSHPFTYSRPGTGLRPSPSARCFPARRAAGRGLFCAVGVAIGIGGAPAAASGVGITSAMGPAVDAAAGGGPGLADDGNWREGTIFAQANVPGARRRNADHDLAAEDAARGEVKRLQELLPPAQSACQGVQYIGAEPDIGMQVYRLKFMQAGGKVCWADMDARTGRVLAVLK